MCLQKHNTHTNRHALIHTQREHNKTHRATKPNRTATLLRLLLGQGQVMRMSTAATDDSSSYSNNSTTTTAAPQ